MTRNGTRLWLPLFPAWLRWALVAAVAAFILFESVTRSPPMHGGSPLFGFVGTDKLMHALGYAGMAGVLAYALTGRDLGRVVLLAFALAVGYGLFVELVQYPLAYRTADGFDLLADAVGAAVAVACWRLLAGRIPFRPIGH